MDKVYITRGGNPYKATKELLKKMRFSIKNKKVFIKANVHPNKTVSTDVNVVKAVAEKLNNCEVLVGGNVGLLGKPFIVNGYDKFAKEYNVKLLDLEKDKKVSMKISKPLRYETLPIAKSCIDCDYLINLAKLKIHNQVKVTLCLKNLFGCIPGKQKTLIHPFVNDAIHDYMQVIRSDLNIIDGIVGNQCDECMPCPVNSNIVIGGRDPLSVDIVGTKCMGVNPNEVKYLRNLNYKSKKIKIVGEKIDDVKINFNRKIMPERKIRNFVEGGLRLAVRLNLISK